MKRPMMKPQDVVVLFSLLLCEKADWVIAEIANGASLSISETHASIRRLEDCGLLSPASRRPIMAPVREFLLHGLKYAFPVQVGGKITRGMPTAHSAPRISERIADGGGVEDTYVWPCAHGSSRGMSVTPLYRTVPEAAQKSGSMYELLALADALCIGRIREKKLAEKLLEKRLAELEAARP